MTNKPFVLLVGGVLVSLVVLYLVKLQDPLGGKAPDVIEQLTGAKTICENRVQDLKQAGINGKDRYEVAQVQADKCIGYLMGVLDQGSGDRAEIEKRLDSTTAACNAFCQWADQELQRQYTKGPVGNIDLAACLSAVLKLFDAQERANREAVKKSLEGCKFRSWHDIPAGTGALK
jgi:hypothetical protein